MPGSVRYVLDEAGVWITPRTQLPNLTWWIVSKVYLYQSHLELELERLTRQHVVK